MVMDYTSFSVDLVSLVLVWKNWLSGFNLVGLIEKIWFSPQGNIWFSGLGLVYWGW